MIGHVLRQDRNSNTNIALTWKPEGRRRRGRPKMTWQRTVEREREERCRMAALGLGKGCSRQQRKLEEFCGSLTDEAQRR